MMKSRIEIDIPEMELVMENQDWCSVVERSGRLENSSGSATAGGGCR